QDHVSDRVDVPAAQRHGTVRMAVLDVDADAGNYRSCRDLDDDAAELLASQHQVVGPFDAHRRPGSGQSLGDADTERQRKAPVDPGGKRRAGVVWRLRGRRRSVKLQRQALITPARLTAPRRSAAALARSLL